MRRTEPAMALLSVLLAQLPSGCTFMTNSNASPQRAFQPASVELPGGSPDSVVQRQVDAYNRRDIDAFLETYSDAITLVNFPAELIYTGKSEMRARYGKMFRDTPELDCEILAKMILGNTVIYHERVTGRAGGPLEVLAIYSVRDGKITRVEFVRK